MRGSPRIVFFPPLVSGLPEALIGSNSSHTSPAFVEVRHSWRTHV